MGLGRDQWGKYHLIFNKVNIKDFHTKLCVCSHNKIFKTCQTGFSLCHQVMPKGLDGQKNSEYGHVAYQSEGDDD